MAFVNADRVKQTSTTTGTGTYDLTGAAAADFQGFVAGIGNGNTCYYCAYEAGVGWEVGIGTVTDAATDTLARTVILESSNADAAVSWPSGTRTIFCCLPAEKFVGLDDSPTWTGTHTFTDPVLIGAIKEDIYTITDGAAFEVDPGNGSIQLITLGASRTPKATNFSAGESVTLMVADGTAYTLTWTDATWGGSGVVWVGGSAPTLATSGYTVIELWKVSTQVYGARVGDVA